jgi:hypothetical protein
MQGTALAAHCKHGSSTIGLSSSEVRGKLLTSQTKLQSCIVCAYIKWNIGFAFPQKPAYEPPTHYSDSVKILASIRTDLHDLSESYDFQRWT